MSGRRRRLTESVSTRVGSYHVADAVALQREGAAMVVGIDILLTWNGSLPFSLGDLRFLHCVRSERRSCGKSLPGMNSSRVNMAETSGISAFTQFWGCIRLDGSCEVTRRPAMDLHGHHYREAYLQPAIMDGPCTGASSSARGRDGKKALIHRLLAALCPVRCPAKISGSSVRPMLAASRISGPVRSFIASCRRQDEQMNGRSQMRDCARRAFLPLRVSDARSEWICFIVAIW
uniref:Oxidoreductase 1 n=1 Tax=Elsinoe fawcettii TaxID=40997 RepID=OXR1_ELSFA|nr:RecName: Full=Oxidoreductase 1; AltName: Full=Elsinochromes biosynthesis cluster protein TSF1 [Elsinoe fawcettii]ABZ01832.1 oxidoreductase [Elsinoe fawcettii]